MRKKIGISIWYVWSVLFRVLLVYAAVVDGGIIVHYLLIAEVYFYVAAEHFVVVIRCGNSSRMQ